MKRIAAIALILSVSALFAASLNAGEANWPTKPVEFVVPANPGGDTDINLRVFLKYLEKELGQSMVVVNMAGGAGAVGMNNVRQSRSDGYRALFYHSGALIAKIMDFIDYDVVDTFEIAAMPVIDKSNCFASNAKAPFDNMKELVAAAKANPGKISFGTESGSFTHLHILALEDISGAKFNIVDAGTAAEKTTALLGGRIDVIGTQYGLINGYIQKNEFKCVGILSDQKLAGAENVHTFAEDGFNLVFDKFFYIGFPKGTDRAIIQKLNDAAKKVAANPDYIKDCQGNFVNANHFSPEESVTYIKGQDVLYRKYEKALTGGEVKK